ncbi:MAG: DoxX family protein [Bacteroidota bacterium]|nr:DoxX family protein [Bacteroidota bacterium]
MKYTPIVHWSLRILVATLFIFSAITKLFPIEAFEKQLVDLGFVNWCNAPILARSIISFELFLGLAFLQNHFFKKFIIPTTAGMLLVFIIHLSWQIAIAGNSGNCGCMGQMIPMTPLEAIIKNIITLILIVILYIKTPAKNDSKHRYPFIIMIVAAAPIFLSYPAHCCCDVNLLTPTAIQLEDEKPTDSTNKDVKEIKHDTLVKKFKEDTIIKHDEPKLKRVASDFSEFTMFSGKKVNINSGKKIVCVFNTSCDHCMGIAKKMTAIASKTNMPPIYILFWSELDAKGEDLNKEVAAFFKFSGSSHPYTMIGAAEFFPKLGKHSSPPRIAVLNEGNMMGDFGEENFSEAAFLKAVK